MAQSILMPGRSFTMSRNQARNKETRSKNQKNPEKKIKRNPINSTISSTHEWPTTPIAKKKKNFTPFRCVGCRETSQLSVPAPIADSQSKKKKKKLRTKTLNFFDGDFDDFVVSRKPHSSKGRVDADKITPKEQSMQRMVTGSEDYPVLDTATLERPHSRADWFGFGHHSHFDFSEGLSEFVMLQNSFMGGRTDCPDRYRSLRLNVDNMSYEELVELGDRIGYVSTGLKENEITQCVRRTKPVSLNNFSHLHTVVEKNCSICQEEYEADDEMGKLGCGHFYHIDCIKQWLMHKNNCPVCKSVAMSTC
ncbi:ring finger domain-containing protein isoform X1 [Solanum lycopersicum]|uniref:ring finger domain-containing protein isoform X1 n=1 Tax=Solanum lycopersicum TaxID=4081 RepID=UPI000532DC5A|nr:ring finger domain-containing protein isoform X1 [Solanum lycopersicum]